MGMDDKHDYDPTKWVDNSEPDIDAEHLNKIEAALQEYGISIDELAAAVGQRIMQSQIVNNLLATKAGNVLDAMQGKALDDKIAEANKNISNNADAVSKLNGDQRIFIDNAKIAGDSPSAFKRGITITTTGRSSSFPIGYGIVLTVFAGDGRGIQINAGPSSNPKIRVVNNGIWTDWSSFA